MHEVFRILTEEDIKDFKTSPNTEAELLEKTLGIVFPVRPSKIELNFYNSWVLLRKPFLRKYTNIQLHELLTASSSKSVSLPRVNAILVVRSSNYEWNHFSSLHENIHSYIGSLNEIFNQAAMSTTSFLQNIPKDFNPLVYKVLDEGMAQWGTVESSAIEKGAETTKQKQTTHEEFLRKARYSYFYRVGYDFIRILMGSFQEAGVNTSSGLSLIVKHPPSGLEQIENPESYFRKLIISSQIGS